MAGDSFLAGQRVLVVSPHADDETLGCGGTIARVKALGGEVYCLIGSLGGIEQYTDRTEAGPSAPPASMRFVSGAQRLAEFRDAAAVLGIDGWDVMMGDEYHIALDTVPQRELIAVIERSSTVSVAALAPTMVLMPACTFNQDHAALYRACLAATRPGPPGRRHQVPSVLVHDNGTAGWSAAQGGFHPNVFVDVTAYADLKMKALSAYVSQGLADSGDEGSTPWAALRVNGAQIGVAAAEAFQALRLAL